MRILLLSFYYPPDLCAGSFRTGSLVAALRERAPPRVQLDVVTTMPNRYSSFGRDAPEVEMLDGLEIHRVRLPSHDSDMAGQSRAFVRFARGAFARVRDRNYDLVFATSSRLMTAALGAWIAGAQRAPLYLDIRDIFADTIEDVLPRIVAWPVARAFSRIERWTVRRANRINLVSPGFEEYFRARYPGSALSGFTNGIDDEFLGAPLQAGRSRSDRRPVVLYAGNIGEGQALHRILPGLARELRARCRFVIIGDGGRRDALERSLAASGVDNVELRRPMPRDALLREYRDADVLFLHLGAQSAFEKVLPSKVFEYAALGKPILAGVSGYAARFIREEITNAAVFPPCDIDEAISAFSKLEIAVRGRSEFVAKYARANIARAMADDVLALLPRSG